MFTTYTCKTLLDCLMLLVVLVFTAPALAMNDPVTGRWITRDPVDFVDGANLYEYLRSQPTQRRDPLGTLTIKGPEAKIVSFIAPFGVDTDLINGATDAWERTSGKVLDWGQARKLVLALHQLSRSANPLPPRSFANIAAWNTFLRTQEHRGYILLQPSLECDCLYSQSGSSAVSSSHVGWTPTRGDAPGIDYMKGEGSSSAVKTSDLGSGCVKFTYQRWSRIGPIGQALSRFLTGYAPPFIWAKVEYTLCCDTGEYDIEFSGSDFPSHYSYVGNGFSGVHDQKNLPAFLFAGPAVLAPGGRFDTASGSAP